MDSITYSSSIEVPNFFVSYPVAGRTLTFTRNGQRNSITLPTLNALAALHLDESQNERRWIAIQKFDLSITFSTATGTSRDEVECLINRRVEFAVNQFLGAAQYIKPLAVCGYPDNFPSETRKNLRYQRNDAEESIPENSGITITAVIRRRRYLNTPAWKQLEKSLREDLKIPPYYQWLNEGIRQYTNVKPQLAAASWAIACEASLLSLLAFKVDPGEKLPEKLFQPSIFAMLENIEQLLDASPIKADHSLIKELFSGDSIRNGLFHRGESATLEKWIKNKRINELFHATHWLVTAIDSKLHPEIVRGKSFIY